MSNSSSTLPSAYEILKNSVLSRPRMMGSPQETETTRFLQNSLESMGLNSSTEDFEWSTAAVNARKVMFLLIGLFLVLLNAFLTLDSPWNGIVTLVAIPCGVVGIIFFGKLIKNDKMPFFGTHSSGCNVVVKIPPKNPPIEESAEIYLTAHSDSIAVNIPRVYVKFMIGSALGMLLIILLAIITSILGFINSSESYTNLPQAILILRITMLVFTSLVLVMIIFNLFSKRVNTSPGACDNGSGSAILLKLAENVHNSPLDHSSVTFIWCAAEEWGLYGSKSYVKKHRDYLDAHKNRIKLINVDMVGSELAYLDKAGLIKKKPLNTHLNQLIEQVAQENQIEARKFNSPIGGNSDHSPFKKVGIEVSCFLAKKDVKKIHRPSDTIDIINPEKIADAVKLIAAVIRKLDTDENNQT